MTKRAKILVTLILNFILLATFLIPTHAAVIADSIVDYNRRGSIYITYEDTVEGTDPVVNAEFTAYRIATINPDGSYTSLIPSIEYFYTEMDMEDVLAKVKEAYLTDFDGKMTYITTTTSDGRCSIQNMELGLYLVEESAAAYNHLKSVPFFTEVPYTENNQWWYEIDARPKAVPCGNLKITKTVQGNKGETNKNFHFIVTLDTYKDPFHFKKSNGEEGWIKSGDNVTLKHGESVEFDYIPVGEGYTVTEQEANQDRYVTTVSGASGYIYRKTVSNTSFVNTRTSRVDTGDSYRYLIAGGIAILCLIVVIILLIVLAKKKKKQNN